MGGSHNRSFAMDVIRGASVCKYLYIIKANKISVYAVLPKVWTFL